MPPTTRAMARRQQLESEEVYFKYFLGLPLEIRTQIYSYFIRSAAARSTITATERESQPIHETRHSLMAVSQQISQECTPLFFRQLRFITHVPRLSAMGVRPSQHPIYDIPRCTPDDFDRFFLRKLSDFRLRNIHSLSYNVGRPTEEPLRGMRADRSGMRELGKVLLSHSGSLECLEELVIYLKPRRAMTPRHVKWDKEKMWHLVSGNGQWDKIEQKLVRRGGPLQGWKVSRRIELGDVPRHDVSERYVLRYVSSTFRKTDDNYITGETLPSPTLVVQIVS